MRVQIWGVLVWFLVMAGQVHAQTWPNEPQGSQLLTDWGFQGSLAPGWGSNDPLQIVADPSAPLSAPSVTQMTFPIGFQGGNGPGNIFFPLPDNVRELYAGYWWKVSNPWQGHSSLGQKIHFFMSDNAGNGGFNQVVGFYGPVNGPWKYDVYFPNTTAVNTQVQPSDGDAIGTRHIFANVNNPDVTLGTWHRIEHYAKLSSTLTSQDGIIRVWVDGVLTHNYTNVNYPQQRFAEFQFAPTWGGTGDVKTQTDYFQFDHVRLSLPNGSAPPDTSPPAAPTNLTVTELWQEFTQLVATVWQWLGPVTAAAETAAADAVTISWPDPQDVTLQYRFRLSHFAAPGWSDLGLKPSALGRFVQALPGLPLSAADRYICVDAQGVRGGIAGQWFSEVAGSPACNQLAMGPSVLSPPPEPEPEIIGPAVVTMSGDKIFIACDATRYTKAKTTGTGTKRTITCLP